MGSGRSRTKEEKIIHEEFLAMDDPKYVHQPPRESEYDHVVIRLPLHMQIRHIVKDLKTWKFIQEDCEVFEYNGAYCVKKELDICKEMITRLRQKYGPISTLGFTTLGTRKAYDPNHIEYDTKGHVAVVENPTASNPNQQYDAYEYEGEDTDGMPKYDRVDIEKHIHFKRPHAAKVEIAHRKTLLQQAKVKPKLKTNQFGVSELTCVQRNHQAEHATNEARNNAMAQFSGAAVDDHTEIDSRHAVQIDYTRKNRHLRDVAKRKFKGKTFGYFKEQKVKKQFTRDYAQDLIRKKQKRWQSNRTGRLMQQQTRRKMEIIDLKHKVDPVKRNKRSTNAADLWGRAQY